MKKILPILLILPLVLVGCTTAVPEKELSSYRQITTQEAVAMMAKETNYIILDVRTQVEYDAGHIPGAVLIPNETISTDEISQLPDKEQLIMIYCRSGNRSKQASEKLVKLGYTNIVEFGGINSWTGEITTD